LFLRQIKSAKKLFEGVIEDGKDGGDLKICESDCPFVCVYDGGSFDQFVIRGIVALHSSLSHFMVCQQFGYALFGYQTTEFTLPGRRLFANLACYLIDIGPQTLYAVQHGFVEPGVSNHVLKSGKRDEHWVSLVGDTTLEVKISGFTQTLMLLAVATDDSKGRLVWTRKDGRGELAITTDVSSEIAAKAKKICYSVTCFDEHGPIEYTLTISRRQN